MIYDIDDMEMLDEEDKTIFSVSARYLSIGENEAIELELQEQITTQYAWEAIHSMYGKIKKRKGFIEILSITASYTVVFNHYLVRAVYETPGGKMKDYEEEIVADCKANAHELICRYLVHKRKSPKVWTVEATLITKPV